MQLRRIKYLQSDQFLHDLNTTFRFVVQSGDSEAKFRITKKELLNQAQHKKIKYYISDQVFMCGRRTMVII